MSTPGAARAHAAVRKALRHGLLPRICEDMKCIDCGSPATAYDHRDYNKPLSVDLVCSLCNTHRGPALPCANPTMERTNIFLPSPYLVKLRALSEETGLSVAELIRRAIDAYLKKENAK